MVVDLGLFDGFLKDQHKCFSLSPQTEHSQEWGRDSFLGGFCQNHLKSQGLATIAWGNEQYLGEAIDQMRRLERKSWGKEIHGRTNTKKYPHIYWGIKMST